jgi:hypothetical protein
MKQRSDPSRRNTVLHWGYANTKTLQTHTHSHGDSSRVDHPVAKAVGYYSVTKDGILYEDWWLPGKDELNDFTKRLPV